MPPLPRGPQSWSRGGRGAGGTVIVDGGLFSGQGSLLQCEECVHLVRSPGPNLRSRAAQEGVASKLHKFSRTGRDLST